MLMLLQVGGWNYAYHMLTFRKSCNLENVAETASAAYPQTFQNFSYLTL